MPFNENTKNNNNNKLIRERERKTIFRGWENYEFRVDERMHVFSRHVRRELRTRNLIVFIVVCLFSATKRYWGEGVEEGEVDTFAKW